MPILTGDCPRCGAGKTTFDVKAVVYVGIRYSMRKAFEAFCVCRHCRLSTVFVLAEERSGASDILGKNGFTDYQGSLDDITPILDFITLKDRAPVPTPEQVPPEIAAAFDEGARCMAVGCYNAAGAMFRLAVDLTTAKLLPTTDTNGLNAKIRRSLGLRLTWMFDNGVLSRALEDLSHCIKDNGNDGAHEGTLTVADAEDLLDFTQILLERIFTEPARIAEAAKRREERRKPT